MLFADLDGLKAINDRFGHAAGDQALIHVAKTLRAAMRLTDIVGRNQSDETSSRRSIVGLSSTAVEQALRARAARDDPGGRGFAASHLVSIGGPRRPGNVASQDRHPVR